MRGEMKSKHESATIESTAMSRGVSASHWSRSAKYIVIDIQVIVQQSITTAPVSMTRP